MSCPLFPSPPVEEKLAAAAEPVLEGTGPVVTMERLPQEPVEKREAERPPARTPEKIIAPERGPEPVVGLASREVVRSPVAEETHAEAGPVAQIAAEQPVVPPGPAAMRPLSRILPWVAGGAVTLLLLCVGTLAVVGLRRFASGIDGAALELPPFLPGSLVLVSVVSFAVAALLVGLLLWSRHRDST